MWGTDCYEYLCVGIIVSKSLRRGCQVDPIWQNKSHVTKHTNTEQSEYSNEKPNKHNNPQFLFVKNYYCLIRSKIFPIFYSSAGIEYILLWNCFKSKHCTPIIALQWLQCHDYHAMQGLPCNVSDCIPMISCQWMHSNDCTPMWLNSKLK